MVQEPCFALPLVGTGRFQAAKPYCSFASRTMVKAYIMVGNLPGRHLSESQPPFGTGEEGSDAWATEKTSLLVMRPGRKGRWFAERSFEEAHGMDGHEGSRMDAVLLPITRNQVHKGKVRS